MDDGPLIVTKIQCGECRHFHPVDPVKLRLTCNAFPDGIPKEISLNQHDHHQPYPGDHGIRFEPK